MALIKCVECSKVFSDKASTCPNCGCPTKYSLDNSVEALLDMNNVTHESLSNNVENDYRKISSRVLLKQLIIRYKFILLILFVGIIGTTIALNISVEKTTEVTNDDITAEIDKSIPENVIEITLEELRAIEGNNFASDKKYIIGTQEQAEYLYTFLPGNKFGWSVESWLTNNDKNYINTFIVDDSSSNNTSQYYSPNFIGTIEEFLPEIYEIKDEGIYVIENEGAIYIYLKMTSRDFTNYVDYIYKDTDFDYNIYLFGTVEDAERLVSTNNNKNTSAGTTVVDGSDPNYTIAPVEDFYHDATKSGASFNGYFYNIDHSDPTAFLKNGPQTQNNNHKDILDQFNNNKDLSTLIEIYSYISSSAFQNSSDMYMEKFGRTVDEIIDSKTLTGCTDYGLVFASIARDKGIPTIFIQTARVDWIYDRIRDKAQGIIGHILIEVYIDGKWRLVDSTAGKYYSDYDTNNFSLNDGYYVFSKSIEVFDSGVSSEQENYSMMMNLFRNFNLEAYSDPIYDYIDMRNGITRNGTPFEFGQYTVTKASDSN